MVSVQSIETQLKKLAFSSRSWGRTEVNELPNIVMPEEIIYECVNGIYEGGFALLVATNFRVLLVDKKPLNFLTVVDLRFDMINEIEYSHRLMGAQITISTGSKTLRFRSYNQQRLRKLIDHVQHSMADAKKQQSKNEEGQNQRLELINQQLQTYLVAQHQNQQEISRQLRRTQPKEARVDTKSHLTQSSLESTDYLPTQSLSEQNYQPEPGRLIPLPEAPIHRETSPGLTTSELLADGMQEVFGKHPETPPQPVINVIDPTQSGLEINAFKIAYSKLPMVLRNRKFARSSRNVPVTTTQLTASQNSAIY